MQAVLAGALRPPSRSVPCARFGVAVAAVVMAAVGLACERAGAATPVNAPTLVTHARTAVDGDRTTLELALSGKTAYKVFGLVAPPRVVVDLAGVRWRVADAEMPKPVGVIGRLRLGNPKPGTARLVIDTAFQAKIDAASLKPRPGGGYTLALVLTGRTRLPVAPLAGDGRLPATTPIGTAPLKVAMGPTPRPVEAEVAAGLGIDGRRGAARGGRAAGRPTRVVVVDPGHGGVDPGAISSRGLYEKNVTLATAREVRSALQAIGGYKVILTRNADVFIPLRTRVAIARRAGADVFLSIHADKMEDENVRGLSVYTLSERASDAEAAALAERENKVDLIARMDLRGAAPDVTGILIDLAQRDTKNSSARMAELVLSSTRSDTLLLQRPHRFAGFAVLKAPDMPSVLIELGFLSNPADEATLLSAAGRRGLARAIARGVDAYFTSVEVAKQG
jgi:N-acetylmuramoyl-L-alanine amidase